MQLQQTLGHVLHQCTAGHALHLPEVQPSCAPQLPPETDWHGAAGVLLNALFPIWIITFLLVAMLVFLTWKTGKKGLQLFRREQRAAKRRAERAAATGGVTLVVLAAQPLASRPWTVEPRVCAQPLASSP